MKRRKWIHLAGGSFLTAGAVAYGFSDRKNLVRSDLPDSWGGSAALLAAEWRILALAPSGHNTQPWFIHPIEPWHWIIGNDSTRWLHTVDPTQRETLFSIGAFMKNWEYAASEYGYHCLWELLADNAQAAQIMEVKLVSKAAAPSFAIGKITSRRTVRFNYLKIPLRKKDLDFLLDNESAFIHYFPSSSEQCQSINQQNLEANRLQSWRDNAQEELAKWVRFSSREAALHQDGPITASMEIGSIPGWVLRNFYGNKQVIGKSFRERSIEKVRREVTESGGWFLITSKDDSVAEWLETGRRMQRLFLEVRGRNIAMHLMTQILEEPATRQALTQSIVISQPIQFILRIGYLKTYPAPVSLRRPVEWFLHK